MNEFKKFDLHLTNIKGLGAVNIISSLLPSINKLYGLKIKNIFVSSKTQLPLFYLNKKIKIVEYKRVLINPISRFFEIIFWRPRDISEKNIVFGDIPLRISSKQVIFLHSTLVVEDLIEHNLWQRYKYFLLRKLFEFNLSRVTAIIVQTEIMKALLINRYPHLIRMVYVLKQPPPKIFFPFKNAKKKPTIGQSYDSVKLFYPSAFYAHKNHAFLSELNPNFHAIKQLILTIPLDCNPVPHVDFIKCVGEINLKKTLAYYLKADALVFFSLTESYGLPLVEAMWLGLPIICPDLPYAKFLCGNQAIYFSINTIGSFEKSVELLIKKLNSGWYPDWSAQLEQIPSDWDYVANKIVDILEI
jgi:glycosyltransferase involved in cell wall biosynthesis